MPVQASANAGRRSRDRSRPVSPLPTPLVASMDRHVRFLAQKILLSTPCLPTPSQTPPRAQHGSTRIKHNGNRLIADATAIGSGTTLPGATIGRTGKRVYIGLSERLVFLSTGSASQGEGAGEIGGVAAGTLARQHNGVVRVFGRGNLAS